VTVTCFPPPTLHAVLQLQHALHQGDHFVVRGFFGGP
jgi:hypothetical protein